MVSRILSGSFIIYIIPLFTLGAFPFSNYEFAKFCWKVLVQPKFYSTSQREDCDQDVTLWLLDNDHKYKASDGIIDLLLRHLRATSMPEKEVTAPTSNVQYAVSINVVIDAVALCFGSSHATSSLVEVHFNQISLSARAILSDFGLLPESEGQNQLHFRSIMSAQYLNTKHNHMESAIEPYPCFGSISVDLPDFSTPNDDGSDGK